MLRHLRSWPERANPGIDPFQGKHFRAHSAAINPVHSKFWGECDGGLTGSYWRLALPVLWRPGVKAWSIIAQAIFVLSNVPGRYCLDRAMHVMPLRQRLDPRFVSDPSEQIHLRLRSRPRLHCHGNDLEV